MEFNHRNRAMQTALELSMLNLNNTSYSMTSPEPPYGLFEGEIPIGTKPKSQNITHSVAVPSSEHVAEIVGRQGCKIKALRAKTNTYIKTPQRGEEPVFIVTGRPEDVASAMREINSAAEHFTEIRAKKNQMASADRLSSSPKNVEGNKVIYVRVPYRVVGLVVGPKGATVKRIQQVTKTYIKTPSRDKDPAFEVRGTPENVQKAKLEIESYIAVRTGGAGGDDTPESSEGEYSSDLSYSPELFDQFSSNLNMPSQQASVAESGYLPLEEPHLSPMASAVFYGACQDYVPVPAPVMPSNGQPFDFTSFSDSLMGIEATLPRPTPMRVNAALSAFAMEKCQPPSSPTYSCESASSDGLSASSPKVKSKMVFSGPSCTVCGEPVAAALFPCGHSLFCMSCANYIDEYVHRCPLCSVRVEHHVRTHFR